MGTVLLKALTFSFIVWFWLSLLIWTEWLTHRSSKCICLSAFYRLTAGTWWKLRTGAGSTCALEMSKTWRRPGTCTTMCSDGSPSSCHRWVSLLWTDAPIALRFSLHYSAGGHLSVEKMGFSVSKQMGSANAKSWGVACDNKGSNSMTAQMFSQFLLWDSYIRIV